MNNITFQTIRAVMVLGIAFFALANEAFAAPQLTPVAVTHLTGTSATLVGHVSNPNQNSTVWFEWGVGQFINTPTTVAVQTLYDGGSGASFEWNLRNLVPGQTYSYRAVAMESGLTVYSPVSSFVAPAPTVVIPSTISSQSGSQSFSSNVNTPATPAKTSAQVQPQKSTTSVVSTKQTTTTTAVDTGFTNGNAAAVIGAGNDIFPTTLIGWLMLILAVLAMVLVAHMIYEAPEKRKIARATINLEEEE